MFGYAEGMWMAFFLVLPKKVINVGAGSLKMIQGSDSDNLDRTNVVFKLGLSRNDLLGWSCGYVMQES